MDHRILPRGPRGNEFLFQAEALDSAHKIRAIALPTWLFRNYSNTGRVHQALGGNTPTEKAGASAPPLTNLANYRWDAHCHGLVQLAIAA
jgi:hypothetical protein